MGSHLSNLVFFRLVLQELMTAYKRDEYYYIWKPPKRH
jgi:hypothetical protein